MRMEKTKRSEKLWTADKTKLESMIRKMKVFMILEPMEALLTKKKIFDQIKADLTEHKSVSKLSMATTSRVTGRNCEWR